MEYHRSRNPRSRTSKRLQDQIDHLRTAIPDLVKPLHAPTKAAIFTGVRKAAAEKADELRTFGEVWRGEETRRVLERAEESERRDGDLGRSAEVGRWGWAEKGEEARAGRQVDGVGV